MIRLKDHPVHRLKAQSFRFEDPRLSSPHGDFVAEHLMKIGATPQIYEYWMYCNAYYETGQLMLNYSSKEEQITCEECKKAYGMWLLQETDDLL